jgi:translation initiation factor IF-2
VTSGKMAKANKMHIFRNGTPITGEIFAKSIKSFKKEMAEIKKGDECTITLDTDFEFQVGD